MHQVGRGGISLNRHVTDDSFRVFMMAVGVVDRKRVPLLADPGFQSISVLSIFAIFSAFHLSTMFFLCCTAVRLVVIYTRKSVRDTEKLSVLCSADFEDDPGKGDSRSQSKHGNGFVVQQDALRFDADSYAKLAPSPLQQESKGPLNNFPDYEGFVRVLLEKLNRDACGNSKLSVYKSTEAVNIANGVSKQPVEHLDVSCVDLQKSAIWGGTIVSCTETGGQFTYCEPSDGSGTHNPPGGQSCHGNQKQSCGGKPAKQGNHKKQKCGSYGAGSRDDDDEDGDDKQKRKCEEILQGCQTSNSMDVEEEKPAGTSEETAALFIGSQETEQNSELASQRTCASAETEGGISQDDNQEVMSEGSQGEVDEESVGEHQTAHQNDPESGVHNSDNLELESLNQILVATFQCQRNFSLKVGQCSEAACCQVQELTAHCAACSLLVYGGCLDCVKFRDLLLYHVAHCHAPKCTHQCSFIKEHIQVHGVPDVQHWTLALDKLFFKLVPPHYPTTQHTAGQPINRGNNEADWDRILARGPVTATSTLSTGQGIQDSSPKLHLRPKKQLLWELNKEKLSITEDGHYDENFEWQQQLYIGGGANGRCYQCIDLKTNFLFAIKKIRLATFKVQELEVWGSLSGGHPNIVELYGAIQTEECVIIFMEFMKGGSVHDFFDGQQTLNKHQALDVLQQAMSAVQFMHSKMILHRDIKGANVLLGDGQVKLADFGAAVQLMNREFQQDSRPCGTEAFMAPEICRSEDHTFSADVWSIMCLFNQLLTGQPPWQQYGHGSLLYIIGSAQEPPPLPQECNEAIVDFFQRGFIIEASQRETVTALLRHRVFKPVALDNVRHARDVVASSDCSADGFGEGVHELSAVNSPSSSIVSDSLDLMLPAGNEVQRDEERISDAPIVDHVTQDPLYAAESSVHACVEQFPPDEQLSDLLLSLSQQIDVTSNLFSAPIPDPTEAVLDLTEFLAELIPCRQHGSPVSAEPMSGSYSVEDLTKVHILRPNGDDLFMVRHNPSVTYGDLAAELHGSVAYLTGLDFFTFTLPEGHVLHVWAAIGSEEQSLKVERAYDTDEWRGWRVDQHGLVEQRPNSGRTCANSSHSD